ncbi:MAG TPA: Ig-like domain-containing protein [Bryobacteraceae bacterium]|nr:Ig-like domain-containing protein [Bryobacteraceae bacterium]
MLLVLQMAASTSAQTLRITSPADGAIVHAGQTLTVVVTVLGGGFPEGVGLVASSSQGMGGWGCTQVLLAPPYVFKMPIPADVPSRPYTLSAMGAIAPGETVDSNKVPIHIEAPATPVKLKNELPTLGLAYVGEKSPLLVTAIFADGSRTAVTDSSLTTYVSDNAAVATVDKDGIVTATGPGKASITITNAGVSTTVPVTVPRWLTITPTSACLNPSQTRQFVITSHLPPGKDTTITWSLLPQVGRIDSIGLYTAPSSVATETKVVVTAASVADQTKSVSAEVLLVHRIGHCP